MHPAAGKLTDLTQRPMSRKVRVKGLSAFAGKPYSANVNPILLFSQ